MKLPIYLDYQSTTPTDPRVFEVMRPYFVEKFGNPHSRTHSFGWEAEEAVEHARRQVASLINADEREVVFTSGATESNNMVLKGVAATYGKSKNHIITVATEHKCVLETCRYLEEQGIEVTYLPVQPNGIIDLNQLSEAITDQTMLVSIMTVNNEIGIIQPIKEIGALCHEKGILFHTDAAQAFGKILLDVAAMHVDLMSISGHKIYGPKGVGALYIRRRPKVRIEPLIHGGGQERGLRSGTLPTPLIVGLGEAAEIASKEMQEEHDRLTQFRTQFYEAITNTLTGVYLNGDLEQSIPGNLNLSFGDVEGEALIVALRDIAVSSGSACSSASIEPSYVLQALGVDKNLADTSIRFGFGRFTTEEEIAHAANHVIEIVKKLREDNPLRQEQNA